MMNKLKLENEQLRFKIQYFKNMANKFYEQAERGELALKRIKASPPELAHRIAEEELQEIYKIKKEPNK